MRAAIYARFSTDMQREASIEDQLRRCRALAEARGYTVVAELDDRATSGASLMRPGIQNLLSRAREGEFDVVLSEALDRLSRGQADVASIFQWLTFSDTRIETISEGVISELHIGLTGTMNALFLKGLGEKTRRGLEGRVLSGKSAGGNAYGYDVVQNRDASGEPLRGDRKINQAQAEVVRRIFTMYADGISPGKIAERLNQEQIPSPRGNPWGASTIHGNKERRTGVLNNELYIGRIVWNRHRYVKDPQTGRRQVRMNPQEEWVTEEVSYLRIIDDALWDAAKARQRATAITGHGIGSWDRRRPRFLLSGLMRCGECGSGFSTVSRDRFGCSAARKRGAEICTNRSTISRKDIESRILRALEHELMDPELVKTFCEEYTREVNRLQAEAHGRRGEVERALAKVKKEQTRLIDAIKSGLPPEQLRSEAETLEERRKTLEAQLTDQAPGPVRLHPKMADTYRERIRELIDGLSEPKRQDAAKDAIRALIDRVTLSPAPEGHEDGLVVDLEGALAQILALSLNAKKPSTAGGTGEDVGQLVMVAGVRFGLTRTDLDVPFAA